MKNFQPQLKTVLRMANGNKETVKRLLAQSARRNPGQSAQWHLDKVQYERDRFVCHLKIFATQPLPDAATSSKSKSTDKDKSIDNVQPAAS